MRHPLRITQPDRQKPCLDWGQAGVFKAGKPPAQGARRIGMCWNAQEMRLPTPRTHDRQGKTDRLITPKNSFQTSYSSLLRL